MREHTYLPTLILSDLRGVIELLRWRLLLVPDILISENVKSVLIKECSPIKQP